MIVYACIISENYWLLMLATISNGFFNLAQFSVSYEMAVHQVKELNIGEATICGCINTMANLIGFVLVLILTPILNKESPLDLGITVGIFLTLLLVSLILMYLVRN